MLMIQVRKLCKPLEEDAFRLVLHSLRWPQVLVTTFYLRDFIPDGIMHREASKGRMLGQDSSIAGNKSMWKSQLDE